MRTLFALLIAMCAASAHAQTFGLHLASVHASPGFNNDNTGAYIEFENGATLGGFRNSLNRDSYYAGYTWHIDGTPISITAMALTGYPKPVATLIPSVELPFGEHLAARLSYVYSPDNTSAVHLSMEWKL